MNYMISHRHHILEGDPKKEFFLVHGYTGSPTDFNGLSRYLHKRFQATVKILCLPGHGTKVEDLDRLHLRHFINFIEKELEKDIRAGISVVLGGVSFGAQVALLLASKHHVAGVFHVCIPFQMKFPFSFPPLTLLKFFKKYWKKIIDLRELEMRKHTVFYPYMHIRGLTIARAANRALKKRLRNITCPCLMIHSTQDTLAHYEGLEELKRGMPSAFVETKVFDYDMKNHNLFFSPVHEEVYKVVGDFFEKNNIFERVIQKDTVAAIIPSFNEAKRIGSVLEVLCKTQTIDEVIVVDDGSNDNTADIVKKYPQVRYLRNEKNMGKSFSMEKGVAAIRSSVIFFCDADLTGLTPEIIESIVRPVVAREVEMFIGVRNNVMQKSFLPFARLSGERALRRELWEKLPKFYRHRFRIEVGLNYYSRFLGRGYRYKVFPYYQSIKEMKYGFWQGTLLRWRMNCDVILGFLRAQCIDYVYWKWFRKV